MDCADADTLAALVANALPEADRAAIAKHAASCESCHALIEGLLDGRGYDETIDSSRRTAPLDLRAGTRVGRYVIGERLGAGGMGVVFGAVDSELQRRVAVKVLRPDGQAEHGTLGRERLLREARMLAQLSHPNVVTVYDVGTHDDNLFLAMELVDGGSLGAWLRRTPRTTDQIVDRMIEAGRGLAAAHSAGVVHRDVKPDNVLVGRDDRARMTDFGLARFEASAATVDERSGLVDSPPVSPVAYDLTRTGALMGTPVYMAPEQMMRGDAEPRTDQWSFCAMLYELIAGVRPFPATDPATRAADIERGRLAPPLPGRRVPRWLLRIVQRGVHADPARRWPSMDVVVEALVRGRRRRGRIALTAAIGGALAIAATAIIVLAVRGTHHVRAGYDATRPQRWVDDRPGCHCPYSACAGRCVSECSFAEYAIGDTIPGLDADNRQEAMQGVSEDGETILYLSGERCALDRLLLARRQGSTFVPVDLTDQLDRTRVAVFEGCCTLTADARSLIISKPDRTGFVRLRLDGTTVHGPDDDAELRSVMPVQPGMSLSFPVISADERTLYFTVYDRVANLEEEGPLEGSYASTRADVHAAFPPGRRLTGRARAFDYITGVSADGLSLFMAGEYETHVLVRATVDEPFADPAAWKAPAVMPGFRSKPIQHCRRMVTTWGPGGCVAERMVWLDGK